MPNTYYYIQKTYNNLYALNERIKELKKKEKIYKEYRLSYNYYYDSFQHIYKLEYIWLEREVE